MPAVGLYVFRVRTATGVAAVEAGESVESGFGVEEGFFCAEGRCEGKPYFVVMRVWGFVSYGHLRFSFGCFVENLRGPSHKIRSLGS
jgi:hypothetical protein